MAEGRGRRMWPWLALLALPVLAWLALCAGMYAQQRHFIYFPQATRTLVAGTDFELRRDDLTLHGWRLHPDQADALIYFGGNAERVQDNAADFDRALPDWSIYLLPYRGYGANAGSPDEARLVADALALYDDVRKRHPHGRIAVIGRSLGSAIAVQVAARRPVDRLVLVTPFDSLAAVAGTHYPWLPVRWLLRDRYESVRHLPAHRGEWLLLRAGHDAVVPPAHTDRLVAAAATPPRVIAFADAGHDDLSASPRYWSGIADFLREGSPVPAGRETTPLPLRR
ncbi:alpha/beta fold hydrolase [Pseudoxanthomonas sp. z9]|uniref:alpha/beta hydrolase n=1 Tax=Pseudoxanthomonas sp. z9 TaxID=2584942 RepID=UPI00210843AD|nr:alpha/beta fold hydrolase [Pseudoxanthomonas sp. z9]